VRPQQRDSQHLHDSGTLKKVNADHEFQHEERNERTRWFVCCGAHHRARDPRAEMTAHERTVVLIDCVAYDLKDDVREHGATMGHHMSFLHVRVMMRSCKAVSIPSFAVGNRWHEVAHKITVYISLFISISLYVNTVGSSLCLYVPLCSLYCF
jgi:hypothetical protein